MRFDSLLLASLLAGGVSAVSKGYHSDWFDHERYDASRDLTVTPKSHPHLFSFTGRWSRRRESFTASLFPAPYFTALIFGSNIQVKLRPLDQGVIDVYAFYVSIDGGNDLRYELPGFNSSDNKFSTAIVPLRLENPKAPAKGALSADSELMPHTLRITSVPATPFNFEGLVMANTLISQGPAWARAQAARVYIEFVGEGLDAERGGGIMGWSGKDKDGKELPSEPALSAFHRSSQWRIGERLGIRHSHILASGSCLLDTCPRGPSAGGLGVQYFQESPVPVLESGLPRMSMQSNLQFQPAQAMIPGSGVGAVSHVIVDVGTLDLVVHDQPVENYKRALLVFLAKMRAHSHPHSEIYVAVHSSGKAPVYAALGVHPDPKSTLEDTSATRRQREALAKVSREVVRMLQAGSAAEEPDTHLHLLEIAAEKNTEEDLLRAICKSGIIQPYRKSRTAAFLRHFGVGTNKPAYDDSTGLLSEGPGEDIDYGPSKAQKLCASMGLAPRKSGSFGNASFGFFFYGTFLVLVVFAVYIGRSTLVGGIAALTGRKRLANLPYINTALEENIEAGLNGNAVGDKEDYLRRLSMSPGGKRRNPSGAFDKLDVKQG